ncbi:hypothetical protein XELAEV_18032417mg [Xenopus laevis]|uniref:Uncharacterized protein n=1 Tax=Xenopus laevis TaxID=8355 RepID=A0A974CQ67_XENLA|nr:hypothetical protein XELAEV_18032417mg [Xenopus laevis]
MSQEWAPRDSRQWRERAGVPVKEGRLQGGFPFALAVAVGVAAGVCWTGFLLLSLLWACLEGGATVGSPCPESCGKRRRVVRREWGGVDVGGGAKHVKSTAACKAERVEFPGFPLQCVWAIEGVSRRRWSLWKRRGRDGVDARGGQCSVAGAEAHEVLLCVCPLSVCRRRVTSPEGGLVNLQGVHLGGYNLRAYESEE